ncbi:MAG: CBS domain-containing protein, partial [Bacteroidetes bacterium]|nr:CBS domain-containing protein [Bacteroidota bacterium]
MIAKDLITESIPPLKTSDTGEQALVWMNEFRVTHLPIVNNKKFLGLISEEDILDWSKPKEAIGSHKLSLWRPFVNFNHHIFEVIKVIADLKLTLLPVVDQKENYLGVITLQSIILRFSEVNSMAEPGGIIILEVNVHDYSLSEMARIVESNDALVLSSYVTSREGSTKMEVTLKVNKTDVRHI